MDDTKYRVIRIKGKKATYLYEDFSYWDKERGYSTHKRRCIGKLGEDGKPVYNKKYMERQNGTQEAAQELPPEKPSARKTEVSSTERVGQNMLFELAERRSGVRRTLARTLGSDTAYKVLALARYALASGKALSRAGDWLESHGLGELGLSSQRVSELLGSLLPDKVNTFLSEWVRCTAKGDGCLFDITSISTYGKSNSLAEWGYNRDREKLEQVNLALLTSTGSKLPVWYSVLPGSMADRVVMKQVLDTLDKLSMPRFVFYGDRGFYSNANIGFLTARGIRHVIPVPSSVGWQKELIAEHRDSLVSPRNLIECGESVMYGKMVRRKDGHGSHFCHIYFDPARKDKVIADFMRSLKMRYEELKTGETLEKYTDTYKKCFTVKKKRNGENVVNYNDEAINEFIENDSCYWVLRSDAGKDPGVALENYRNRNDVEINFDDMKNTSDLERLRNHNDQTVSGKIFVMFIALVLKCQLRRDINMIPPKERKYWSEQDFLDKVDSYTKVHFSGRYKDVYSTPTSAQRLIFDLMGLPYSYQGNNFNANASPKYDS